MFNLLLLLGCTISLIIGVSALMANKKSKVLAVFCITISVVTGTLTFMPEKILGQTEKVRIEEYELIKLNLRKQTKEKDSWDIIPGYASIGEKTGYTFYLKSKEGGIRKGKLSEKDDVVIFEMKDRGTKPRIQEITTYYKLGGPKRLRELLGRDETKIKGKEYKIFVPTGTIIKEFSI